MLADRGRTLADVAMDANLWGITGATFYQRLKRHQREAGLPATGVHLLRHTAAKLRRDAGESVEAVSSFLDRSSLAVTSIYLRRLEREQDTGRQYVAEAISV